jgi:hypothetical protein
VIPAYQTGCEWTRTASPTQRNKKIPKKKKVAQVLKITNFYRQPALFDGASMGVITLGFSEVRQLNSPVWMVR